VNAIEEIASKLSLGCARTDGGFVFERHGLEFEISGPTHAPDVIEEALWYHRLLGVRYGLDRRTDSFDYAIERPTGDERPRNTYERRSLYGERLQRIVSRLSIAWAETVCGESLFVTPWAFDDLAIVYVYEVDRIWHVWGSEDFEHVDFDAENLEEFGRLALFYESYKPRPKEERFDWGRIRTYRSNEGLTASRALLLPDFDYDAAQADGYFALPSRDCMLTVEPRKGERARGLEVLQERAREEFEAALLPFTDAAFELHRTEIGERVPAEFELPEGLEDDLHAPRM